MATPTTYNLTYDAPCDVEAGCGDVPCGGKPEFNPRPQIFCKDATVQGNMFVAPDQIFVGGARYTPQLVEAVNGFFICLARS